MLRGNIHFECKIYQSILLSASFNFFFLHVNATICEYEHVNVGVSGVQKRAWGLLGVES